MLLAAWALGAACQVRSDRAYAAEGGIFEAGRRVRMQGTLVGKEQKEKSWQLTLELPGFENLVIVTAKDGGYPLDGVLSVEGTVMEFRPPRNEGQFNEQNYYRYRQIIARIYADYVCVDESPPHAWREGLYELRGRLCDVYKSALPEDVAGIMSVMAAGEKAYLNPDVKADFQRAGISHILAISGMHISMIGTACYALLRGAGRSYGMSAAASAALLYFYGTMIGMGVSARRAIGMFCLYLLAQCIGRRYDTPSALAALAIVLLVDAPGRLLDVSFQFSFLAVAGVVTADAALYKKKGGLFAAIRPVLASLLLQLFTLPLVAYYYYELPAYALLLNMALLPYLGAALGFGLVGGCIGLFSMPIARILLLPCRIVLTVYIWACDLVGNLPGASVICGKPSMAKLCLYYLLLAALIWRLYIIKKRAGLAENEDGTDVDERAGIVRGVGFETGSGRHFGGKRPGRLLAGCAARCVIGAAVLAVILCHVPRGAFELDYLDVGQGDGSMIRTENGTVCFVDGGSTDVDNVGTYRILPFLKSKGIRHVDYWILSHLDEDHVNGFYEALDEGYDIRAVVVSAYMTEDEAKLELLSRLSEHGVPLLAADAGDALYLDGNGSGWGGADADAGVSGGPRLQFLSPGADTDADDRNGASLVFLYDDGETDALWTGDIGARQEKWLLEHWNLPRIDVYKAAHHGSDYSNSAEYLQAIAPRISVVSCAERNRYGHPGADAVAHMEQVGSIVRYTMREGQIKIVR